MQKLGIIFLLITIFFIGDLFGQPNCYLHLESDFAPRCISHSDQFPDQLVACKGSTVTYSAVGNCDCDTILVFEWEVLGADSLYFYDNMVIVTWGHGDAGYVHLTYNDGCMCQCSLSLDVSLVDPPVAYSQTIPAYFIDGGGNKIIQVCRGGTVIFTDSSDAAGGEIVGHTWYGPNGSASSLNFSIDNIVENTEVSHRIVNSCGCVSEEHYQIVILDGENLELSCYGAVCEGDVVSYEVLNPPCNTYLWHVTGGHIISGMCDQKVMVVWDEPQAGYGELAIDGTRCGGGLCPMMFPKKIPIVQNHVPITGRTSVCKEEYIKYTIPMWGGVFYEWKVFRNSVLHKRDTCTNEIVVFFDTSCTYKIVVSYSSEFLDCDTMTSDTLTVVVKPPLTIEGKRRICLANNCNLFTTDSSTVRWRIYYGYDSLVVDTVGEMLDRRMPLVGTYRVVASSTAHCDSAELFLTVEPPPAAPTFPGGTGKRICLNTSETFYGIADNPQNTLLWYPTDTTCASPGYATGDEVTIKFFANRLCPVDVYQYNRELQCRSDSAAQISVTPFSLASAQLPHHIYVCPNSHIDWNVPNQSNVLYKWKIQQEAQKYASIQGDAMSPNVQLVVNDFLYGDSVLFYVILERLYCSGLYKYDTVYVHLKRSHYSPVNIIHNSDSVCKGDIVDFHASGADQNSYRWKADEDIGEWLQPSYSYAFNHSGMHRVTLKYSPFDFCRDATYYSIKTDSVYVNHEPPVGMLVHDTNASVVRMEFATPPTGLSFDWYYNGILQDNFLNENYTSWHGYGVYGCVVTDGSGCTASVQHAFLPGQSGTTGCEHENRVTWDSISPFDACRGTITLQTNSILGNNPSWSSGGPFYSYSHNGNSTTVTFHQTGDFVIKANKRCAFSSVDVSIAFVPAFSATQVCDEIVIDNGSQITPGIDSIVIAVGDTLLRFAANEREIRFRPDSADTYNFSLDSVIYRYHSGYIITCDTFSCAFVPRPHDSVMLTVGNIFDTNLTCDNTPILLQASLSSGRKIVETEWFFGDSTLYKGDGYEVYHTFGSNNPNGRRYDLQLICTDTDGCQYTLVSDSIFSFTHCFFNDQDNLHLQLEKEPRIVCPYDTSILLSTIVDIDTAVPTLIHIFRYSWNKGDSFVIDSFRYVNHSATYTVRAIDQYMCQEQASVFVPFKNAPAAVISSDRWEYCFGDTVTLYGAPDMDSDNYYYQWIIVSPNGNVRTDSTATVAFVPDTAGNYNISLCVTNVEGCKRCATTSDLVVNPLPTRPTIAFEGTPCIENPPVNVKNDSDNRALHWSNGYYMTGTSYYTHGPVAAFCYDSITGCKSEVVELQIPKAPNIDAVPSGCYKICRPELPFVLHCYGVSQDLINWEWKNEYNSIVDFTPGMVVPLPVDEIATYYLDVEYNNGCHVKSPDLTIEESPECKCKELRIEYSYKYYIDDCQDVYDVTLIICNESNTDYCFDSIGGLHSVPYANVTGAPSSSFSVAPNDCKVFAFTVEALHMPEVLLPISLQSTRCYDCYKDFVLNLKPDATCQIDIDIDITGVHFLGYPDLRVDFRTDVNPPAPSGGDSTFVAVDISQYFHDVTWITSPPSNFYYEFDGNISFSGWADFSIVDIELMASVDSLVCFYMYFCVDGSPCVAVGCVKASDILEMLSRGTPPQQTKKNGDYGTNSITLVPNPTSGLVEIKGTREEVISCQVFDIFGREIACAIDNNTVNLTYQPSGVYVIKIIASNGKIVYTKIIKK